MDSRLALLPLLFLTLAFQSPDALLERRYRAAQEFHREGKVPEAAAEYRAALGEAYAQLGRILLAQGDYPQALVALQHAVADGRTLVDLATAHFHARQYEQAIEPLKIVLAANPRATAARHLLGKSYFMLRQFDKASQELTLALRAAPADVDVAYTLALARLKQQQPIAARQIFNRLLLKLGKRAEVYNLFGRAYRETGYFDEAVAEFKRALALNPKYPRAHYNIGLSYLLKDGTLRLKEAAAALRAELAINPEEFLALYNLGIVCVVEKQFEEALRLLEKAARLRPLHPGVSLFLGNACHGTGKYERAIEHLKNFLTRLPPTEKSGQQAAEAHFLLGQSLVRVGRVEEAERELEIARELKARALETDREKIVAYLNTEEFKGAAADDDGVLSALNSPDDKAKEKFKAAEALYRGVVAKIHNQFGLLYADNQDFAAAAAQFQAAVNWDAQLPGAAFNLGLARYKTGQYKEAIAPLLTTLEGDGANLPVKHLLGMSYFLTEDFAKATPLLRESLAAQPKAVSLYYALSLALIKQGKVEEAGEVMQGMVALSGDSAQLHILLGQAHHAQNNDEKALEELSKASQMEPRLPMAHYYAGLIYIKLGKFVEAARQFEAELSINANDVQAKYHLAFALLTGGEGERGLKLMQEVVASAPDFADARFELGKAQLAQGDVSGAVVSLEAARELGPDKSHIHYQLGRAYTAAGREAEARKCFETFQMLKDKERSRSPED